ncbi:unnamed protein product, partial [Urochloa humidicola]
SSLSPPHPSRPCLLPFSLRLCSPSGQTHLGAREEGEELGPAMGEARWAGDPYSACLVWLRGDLGQRPGAEERSWPAVVAEEQRGEADPAPSTRPGRRWRRRKSRGGSRVRRPAGSARRGGGLHGDAAGPALRGRSSTSSSSLARERTSSPRRHARAPLPRQIQPQASLPIHSQPLRAPVPPPCSSTPAPTGELRRKVAGKGGAACVPAAAKKARARRPQPSSPPPAKQSSSRRRCWTRAEAVRPLLPGGAGRGAHPGGGPPPAGAEGGEKGGDPSLGGRIGAPRDGGAPILFLRTAAQARRPALLPPLSFPFRARKRGGWGGMRGPCLWQVPFFSATTSEMGALRLLLGLDGVPRCGTFSRL